jgi:hypothetical protein
MTDYIIKPAPHLLEDTLGMLKADPIRGLPVYGEIIAAPPSQPGQPGQRAYFQWNALLEADPAPGGVVIGPSLLYMAGGVCMNGYLFVRLHVRPTDPWGYDTDPLQYGQGEVLACPRNTFLSIGDNIIFNPKLSHRVVAEEYDDDPVYALKIQNVLMYR